MEKLVLKKEDTYKLQVNDEGEYIEFDLTDLSLPERIMSASENIVRIDEEYNIEMSNIENKFQNDDVAMIKAIIQLEKNKCLQLRREFDSFLGEGACQKIFGNTNRYGMFYDLFDALEPHFAKMEINIKKAKSRLVQKFAPKRNDVM